MLTRAQITEDYIRSNIGNIFSRCNHKFVFTPYILNIFGIRLETNTDKFDDVICIVYFDESQNMNIHIFDGATDPGIKYLKSPLNSKGTAILVPGQYKNTWVKGPHGKTQYTALRQSKSVKVYRDNDRDVIHDLDPDTIDEGIFYINIHRAEQWSVRSDIGSYSAGCQVIQKYSDFEKLMELVELSIKKTGIKYFTYTLFTKEQFTDYGIIL